MRSGVRSFWLILGFGLACAPAGADTVIIFPQKDNTIIKSDPTFEFSNGQGAYFFVGRTNSDNEEDNVRRGAIQFDIAGNVPAGSTITSATLRVRVSKTQAGSQTVRVRRFSADWGEGPSNAGEPGGGGTTAEPGDVSWRFRYYPTVPWAINGGEFSPSVSAQINLAGNGSYMIASTPQLVADVQSFLDQPSQNFGWILIGNENVRSAKRLDSRENPTPSFRPYLVVNFNPPAALLGDLNCDGMVSVSDIGAFVLALTNPAEYATQYPSCDIDLGDLTNDGQVSVSDIGPFVQLLTGG